MSGCIKVSLIEASGLKLQRWTGDNVPYVTVRSVNLEATSQSQGPAWRSATALEGDIGSRWQRGSNCKWRDAGCSFEYDLKLEQVAQVTNVGAQRPRLEITCCDEQQGAADKTIGKGALNLGMLLCGPAGIPVRSSIELLGRRGTPHGIVVLEVYKVAPPAAAPSSAPPTYSHQSAPAQPAAPVPILTIPTKRYYSINPHRGKDYFDAADNAAITAAHQTGVPALRLPDKPYGSFEVRFGANAVSRRLSQPPPSGMIQVNTCHVLLPRHIPAPSLTLIICVGR
jgi:hypothetical protein